MKTAEEWREKFPILIGGNDKEQVIASYNSFIQEIQLDAMKEGMRRAAKVAGKSTGPVESTPMRNAADYQCAAILAESNILTAAEQLTEKDL